MQRTSTSELQEHSQMHLKHPSGINHRIHHVYMRRWHLPRIVRPSERCSMCSTHNGKEIVLRYQGIEASYQKECIEAGSATQRAPAGRGHITYGYRAQSHIHIIRTGEVSYSNRV
ncbi:hypothetical protein CY34DRAFT_389744 [Suillus luteus UH-Slu-Lm8-n1]|uniref:Uncharacterized protein n=1 Tax=Suillus luteus UH-Slu-Lm8-n1 TaxID=930992 RepID=A0A0D0AVW0_9AGAM|nr:hypothetical protein CY34DRAFT_389744 [Suillus luteus UH-Slu-Lm8-n1]